MVPGYGNAAGEPNLPELPVAATEPKQTTPMTEEQPKKKKGPKVKLTDVIQ